MVEKSCDGGDITEVTIKHLHVIFKFCFPANHF